MGRSTILDQLQAAINSNDIDAGMHIIDAICEWTEMEGAISLLNERNSFAASAYLLGHLWCRYEKWSIAYLNFIKAADGGINSAFFRAGKIVKDHPDDVVSVAAASAHDLFAVAARNGHIWSKRIVLRELAMSSNYAKLVWWANRFFLLPFWLIISTIDASRRDNFRY